MEHQGFLNLLTMIIQGLEFSLIPKPQIIYRQSSSSASSKVDRLEKSTLKVINRAFEAAPLEYKHLKSQSLAWSYRYLARQHLKHQSNLNSLKLATQKIFQAVCIQPSILLEDYTQGLIRHLTKQWILMCTLIIFKTFGH